MEQDVLTCTNGQVGVPQCTWRRRREMGLSPALKVFYIIAFSTVCFLLVPVSVAQSMDVSGRYQCAEAKVRGKVVPCTAAPLTP